MNQTKLNAQLRQLAELLGGEPDVLIMREALTRGRRLFCKDERAFLQVLSRMVTDGEGFLPYRQRLLKERRDAWLR